MDNSFGKIPNKTVIKQRTKEKNNLSSCNAAIKGMVAITKADKQCNNYFLGNFHSTTVAPRYRSCSAIITTNS